MVYDGVKHQAEIIPQASDIIPIPKRRVDSAVIDNREAIVRGIWVEGQNVDGADHIPQVFFDEVSQGLDGRLALMLDHVPIGDQNRIALTNTVLWR